MLHATWIAGITLRFFFPIIRFKLILMVLLTETSAIGTKNSIAARLPYDCNQYGIWNELVWK